jgi:hypothetical protein
MNEDYLWDKSGEPDPEIERLEQTLGRLRYKRPVEPLPLPALTRPWYRPGFSPMLAIAATLVILLLAGGLWLGLRRTNESLQQVSGPPRPVGPIDITASGGVKDQEKRPTNLSAPRLPVNRSLRRAQDERRQELANLTERANRIRREQQINREGELAKEQLIKALLITSDKLNAVQKKIQGNQERGPVS